LYQYQICPFCNIVKSVLNFSKIPYQTIEVNPLTKAEIKWSQGYTKVPIATADDKHWFGSDDIVHGVLNSTNTKITSKKGDEKWTKYAMDDLAPLLYPNLCNTLGNSYRAFDYVHSVPSFSTLQKFSIQSIGSLAMYMAASKIKRKSFI
jgi:microsomal prostaglandin-E synthase 2